MDTGDDTPDTPVRLAIALLEANEFVRLGIGETRAKTYTLVMQRRREGEPGVECVTFIGEHFALGTRCRSEPVMLDVPDDDEKWSGTPTEVVNRMLNRKEVTDAHAGDG